MSMPGGGLNEQSHQQAISGSILFIFVPISVCMRLNQKQRQYELSPQDFCNEIYRLLQLKSNIYTWWIKMELFSHCQRLNQPNHVLFN